MTPTAQFQQLLDKYNAKHQQDGWRGTVYARFTFGARGVTLEDWSVDLPRTEESIGFRRGLK